MRLGGRISSARAGVHQWDLQNGAFNNTLVLTGYQNGTSLGTYTVDCINRSGSLVELNKAGDGTAVTLMGDGRLRVDERNGDIAGTYLLRLDGNRLVGRLDTSTGHYYPSIEYNRK
jgi:hypothetical protein